jgi:hypothetical protein
MDDIVSLLDLVQQHVGPNEIQQISQEIDADPATTQAAVQAAVPMLVGGMASNAQQPGGASAIQQALSSHGGLLGGLGSLGAMFGGGDLADVGGGLLGKVLGGHQATVQQGVSQTSGLDPDKTKKLLMILAPIVMGVLAKRHANASHEEIGGALQQDAHAAQEHAKRTSPQLGGLLGKIMSHVETPRS